MKILNPSQRDKVDIYNGDIRKLKKLLQEDLNSRIKILIESRVENKIEQGQAQVISALIKLLP
jgi:hypothetical protein